MLRHSFVITGMRRCACSEHTACASSPEEWLFELRTKAKEWRKVNGMGKSPTPRERQDVRQAWCGTGLPSEPICHHLHELSRAHLQKSPAELVDCRVTGPSPECAANPPASCIHLCPNCMWLQEGGQGKRLHLCSEWGNHYSYWVKIFQCSLLQGEAPTLL